MLNPMIDQIDIWTTAQIEKNGGGRGNGSVNQSAYGIKKLRELILELAVRGKLVPQDPNDEPASVLIQKITKEKARLIKERKIKKKEPPLEIDEDEKPFVLPTGWQWVRLGRVTEFINGFAFKSSDFSDIGVGVVKIGDIQNGEITTISMSRVQEGVVLGLDDSLRVNNGDMLIAMSGATTGKLGFNRTNEVFYINQRVGKIVPYCSYIEYLYYPLTTKIAENLAKSMGSAIPNLSTAQIKNIIFALPPLPEQHRIVAKVDELMALCDQLEQQQTDSSVTHQTLVEALLTVLTTAVNLGEFSEAWQLIAGHFDNLFTTEQSIDQLKQTILQLAVMGKLVPQDPSDEPASVLLEKIAQEKAQLTKEGRIKKEKPLSKITEAEKPFELPKGWEWARLGTALKKITDGTHHSPPNSENGEFLYISAKNIKEEGVLLNNVSYVTEDIHNEIHARCDPEYGDILYIKDGTTTGITTINNLKEPFSMLSSIALLKVPEEISNTYLLLSLRSPYFYQEMRAEMTGVAITRVTLNKLNEACISLPPLAEQHRIVAKVDELMVLCDILKARLKDAQITQVQLADTIVEEAVS